LKILYVSPGYYPRIGGVEYVVKSVAERLVRMRHEVIVLAGEPDIVYCKVGVSKSPQVKFYRAADPIRKRLHICQRGAHANGQKGFREGTSYPPCLAEDYYILFKALELGYLTHSCTKAYVETERTSNAKEEEAYKARTTLGIYQVLKCIKVRQAFTVD